MKKLTKLYARPILRIFEIFIQSLNILFSLWYWHELKQVSNKTQNIKKKDVLLFCTLRNEAIRIPFFLDYYKKLGVKHFLLVDNGSTDNFMDLVANDPAVSVWHTIHSYKKSNYGMHWMNYLLRRYGSGHWCITCDPDEFLIYPYCEDRNLNELAEFLEGERRQRFFSIVLDMYSDKSISTTNYHAHENPLESCPFFDKTGYVQTPSVNKIVKINGGPRRRHFFYDCPDKSPSLHKIPMIKWRWSYSYLSSTHAAVPYFLNQPNALWHLAPTGCLLHFKFTSSFAEKVKEEIDRKQHFDSSFEYKRYHSLLENEHDNLFSPDISLRYKNWKQLADLGLMNIGQWF